MMLPDYSANQFRIVFIGCGAIAQYHYDVFFALGIDIVGVSARKRSKHLKSFASKNDITSYTDNRKMIETEIPDAVVVLSSWAETEKVVDEIIDYNLPMLIEKPVALNSKKIEGWISKFPKCKNRIQIGYNRRFYDFIPEVKKWIDEHEVLSVEAQIPESYRAGLNKKEQREIFFANSSHVIDLLYFLLGKKRIDVISTTKSKKGTQGYNALLKSTQSNIPIHLIANWGSPSNFGLVFHGMNSKLVLSPLEEVTIFEGMKVENSAYEGMKSYTPKKVESYFIDPKERFKPGFLGQTINFLETIVLKNVKNSQACNVKDALQVAVMMENVTK